MQGSLLETESLDMEVMRKIISHPAQRFRRAARCSSASGALMARDTLGYEPMLMFYFLMLRFIRKHNFV